MKYSQQTVYKESVEETIQIDSQGIIIKIDVGIFTILHWTK